MSQERGTAEEMARVPANFWHKDRLVHGVLVAENGDEKFVLYAHRFYVVKGKVHSKRHFTESTIPAVWRKIMNGEAPPEPKTDPPAKPTTAGKGGKAKVVSSLRLVDPLPAQGEPVAQPEAPAPDLTPSEPIKRRKPRAKIADLPDGPSGENDSAPVSQPGTAPAKAEAVQSRPIETGPLAGVPVKDKALKTKGLEDVLLIWSEAMGGKAVEHVQVTGMAKGVLTLAVNTEVWAREVVHLQTEIITRVNSKLGEELVREVKIKKTKLNAQTSKGKKAVEVPVPEKVAYNCPYCGTSAETEVPRSDNRYFETCLSCGKAYGVEIYPITIHRAKVAAFQ